MQNLSDGGTHLYAGRALGRYELLVPIASGGMAQVWAARLRGARQFQKIVAIKTMLPQLSEDPQFEQMFLDEASLASRVRHPNAVETLDLGEEGGILYLVMELIEGVPLNQLMKAAKSGGGIPPAIAVRIALHTCSGLHAAHELKDESGRLVGLVHRDVSPQNLLVTFDGVTKVVDFGVAKATALGGGATTAGQVKGKVSYMAPEQVLGEGLDRRADVFAMGIVLYALTTGKHPFRRESEAATMYHICSSDRVVAPSRVLAGYPSELEPIVLKALEKNRDDRYSSCDEMRRALDALPAHLRVASDADVGDYLKSLFGDLRGIQRKRIEEAITHADSTIQSGIWPGSDVPTLVGGRESIETLVPTSETTGWAVRSRRNAWRNRVIGGLGLAVLALSSLLFFQITHSKPRTTAGPGLALDRDGLRGEMLSPETAKSPGAGASALDSDQSARVGAPQVQTPDAQKAASSAPAQTIPSGRPKGSATPPPVQQPSREGTSKSNTGSSRNPTAVKEVQPASAPSNKPNESWKFDAGF